jgi:muramoyltetrapeptide carboxypeptidase
MAATPAAVRAWPLRSGDAVAVVSPSSPVPTERLDAGLRVLTDWGLRPREGRHSRARNGHLAGTDEQRAADLDAAFADPQVRAVWASRGGYGMTRILDRLDWEALARDPKLLIGFSDVSALLVAAWQRIGLIGLHGQFVARLHLLDDGARQWLHGQVFGVDTGLPRRIAGTPLPGTAGGRVTGPLIGGNLAVLTALAGTADRLHPEGCVVLLEEVDEAPYAVDRMLTQLRHSGGLDGAVGVVVGTPVQCQPRQGAPSATFDDVVQDRLGDLGVPVLVGLPVGHLDDQRAVPHGGQATLDADRGVLELD